MKQLVKKAAIGLLAHTPVLRLLHAGGFRRNAISIFTYHALIDAPLECPDWCFLDLAEFEKQIAYLAKHFHVISISEAVRMLAEGTVTRPCAVVTFDDGFQSQADLAVPILEKYGVPGIIYLTSNLMDRDKPTWFSRLILALSNTKETILPWEGVSYPIATQEDKSICNHALQQSLKTLHQHDLVEMVCKIEKFLGTEVDPAVPLDSPFRMMSADTIRKLSDHPLIEFGAHTQSHAILSLLNPEQKYQEIKASIRDVEALTGKICEHFAYPNGRDIDFDHQCKKILDKYHIHSAVTMNPGPAMAPMDDNYHIPRYPVGSDTSFGRFILMAHHIL